MQISRRPEKARKPNVTGTDDEKSYRSRLIKLDIGGRDAEEGAWAGETIVPMRIIQKITKVSGRLAPTHMLEGFDPETGEAVAMFFEPTLKEDGSYKRNFAGGLAEALGEKMSPEEFDAVVDAINEEQGTDYIYDFNAWKGAGGPIKLKAKWFGVPITIGKEAIKTKSGTIMHVVTIDGPVDENGDSIDYDDVYLRSLIERYMEEMWSPAITSKKRHGQPATEKKPEGASSSQEEPEDDKPYRSRFASASKTPATQEPARKLTAYERAVLEQKEADAKIQPDVTKGSNGGRNMFMSEDPQEATGRGFDPKRSSMGNFKKPEQKNNRGREVVSRFKPTPKPEPEPEPAVNEEGISGFVSDCLDMGAAVDQVIMQLVQEFDISPDEAREYVKEFIESEKVDNEEKNPETMMDSMIEAANEMKAEHMSLPEAFSELGKRFPVSTKEDRKNAMRKVGLIQVM